MPPDTDYSCCKILNDFSLYIFLLNRVFFPPRTYHRSIGREIIQFCIVSKSQQYKRLHAEGDIFPELAGNGRNELNPSQDPN